MQTKKAVLDDPTQTSANSGGAYLFDQVVTNLERALGARELLH